MQAFEKLKAFLESRVEQNRTPGGGLANSMHLAHNDVYILRELLTEVEAEAKQGPQIVNAAVDAPRTVIVQEKRRSVPYCLDPVGRGTFHGFMQDFNEDCGCAQYPVALVERENGQMEVVFAGHIKFEKPTPVPPVIEP